MWTTAGSSKHIKIHSNTITSAGAYTNNGGRTGRATARADDRGRGAAFITIALRLTPAINTSRFSPLNLSIHTMHIIPLSQNRPGDTRKHLEIQTVHCGIAHVLRNPKTHTHTHFPSTFLDFCMISSLFHL